MLHKRVDLLLLVFLSYAASLSAATVSATAKLTISGAEQITNGVAESGEVTAEFNGFVESVHYGQYSTPASIASALAAMFMRDYHQYGLFAKAGANGNADPNVITFQLVDGQSFGAISFVGPTTSFSTSDTGFTGTAPVVGSGGQVSASPLITGISPNVGAAGRTSVVITGQKFGSSAGGLTFNGIPASPSYWSDTTITVTVPAGATTGPITLTVGGTASNSVLFRAAIPAACPVN